MDGFNLVFLPSLHLFFRQKYYTPQEKNEALSILLGQEQPGEMEPSACQNPLRIQTRCGVKRATSESGPWGAAREGAGIKASERIAASRHPTAAGLAGKLCSKGNEPMSSSEEELLLHHHVSAPVLILTNLPSLLSRERSKKKGRFCC